VRRLDLADLPAAPSGTAGASGEVSAAKEEVASGRAHGVRQICRQLFGIPDYERYLAHAAAHHPGEPVLSRREFYAQAIERKYGKSGPRCC
jgi:uncharacterized short protein YbdD (DUF466 family)